MKKYLLTLAAVAAVTAGVVGLSAFESHIINVTAHIENALKVDTTPIAFGTVFPQEYTERRMAVGLSDSFKGQDRINDVEYKIVQKPKPLLNVDGKTTETTLAANAAVGASKITVNSAAGMVVGTDISIGYHGATMERRLVTSTAPNGSFFDVFVDVPLVNAHVTGEKVIVVYKDLCRFLSKMPDVSPAPGNDTGVPSYFHEDPAGNFCAEPTNHVATGVLANYNLIPGTDSKDLSDVWTIDLKVPPIKGQVAQDWPATCQSYVVEKDGEDYGCDLWVEVTGFTKDGQPVTGTPTPSPSPTPTVTPSPTPTTTPTPGETITLLNVGDTASEANFEMLGWGNTVWPGVGGGWGGGDDGTIRTVSAPIPDDMYKAPYAAELPSTDSATVIMNFGAASATKKIQIRHLDGTADDHFHVYVDGVQVGDYPDNAPIADPEVWLTDSYDVSAYNGIHTVRIHLAGVHWANYNSFGQLGISWIKIVQ